MKVECRGVTDLSGDTTLNELVYIAYILCRYIYIYKQINKQPKVYPFQMLETVLKVLNLPVM